MVRFLAFAVVTIAVAAFGALAAPEEKPALPPLPSAPDSADMGKGIQRTMTLLATSTPAHRNTVNVLYYGQSITNQEWTDQVSRWLREKYPNADLHFTKLSLGGFASQRLVRTTDYDVLPLYPDLMIFHVYGSHIDYESILRITRQRTTAEIAISNDHVTVLPVPPGDWSEKMSFDLIPGFARKYGCYLMDIRTPWREYLEKNGFQPKQFLSDDVHLNDNGKWLLASLIEQRLVYRPDLPADDWKNMVRTYTVGKDLNWQDGKLTLEFTGNRVDALSAWTGQGQAGAADVLIDGKKPSEFPVLYYHARPSGTPKIGWPAIMRISSEKPMAVETWTLTAHDFNDAADQFKFELSGSVTGPDGSGSGSEKFVSNSGRVVIEPGDWVFAFDRQVSKKPMPAQVTVTWQTKPLFVDTYTPEKVVDPSLDYPTSLARLLTKEKHTLQLVSQSGQPLPVAAIRIYEAPVK